MLPLIMFPSSHCSVAMEVKKNGGPGGRTCTDRVTTDWRATSAGAWTGVSSFYETFVGATIGAIRRSIGVTSDNSYLAVLPSSQVSPYSTIELPQSEHLLGLPVQFLVTCYV
jgi:hypothetical protein